MRNKRVFAASGSCICPVKEIHGTVTGITFTSDEFSGTMDNQKFWDRLRAYAKAINKYVELVY